MSCLASISLASWLQKVKTISLTHPPSWIALGALAWSLVREYTQKSYLAKTGFSDILRQLILFRPHNHQVVTGIKAGPGTSARDTVVAIVRKKYLNLGSELAPHKEFALYCSKLCTLLYLSVWRFNPWTFCWLYSRCSYGFQEQSGPCN